MQPRERAAERVGLRVRHVPRHADAVNNAGVELGRNEQHAAALKAFNRAVGLEPSNRNYQANHRLATKNARDHRRIAESDDVWAPS